MTNITGLTLPTLDLFFSSSLGRSWETSKRKGERERAGAEREGEPVWADMCPSFVRVALTAS